MSMVVKNNMSAVHTLNTLNQNSSALQKSLAKVSSGMKINSAQDDASAYAISESMRVRIRSLDQAGQNTQNASAMIKTAEGAVASTLELVKTMKEKAINSANDTNTDSDRLTIQKEMDQFIDQVDDNSLITFNGKMLLDGSSMPIHANDYTDEQNIIRGLNSAWISDALELIKDSYGIDFESGSTNKAAAKYLDVSFAGGNSGNAVPTGFESAVAWAGSSYNGEKVTLTINLDNVSGLDPKSQDGAFSGSGTQYLDRVIAHELTHGVMANRFQSFSSMDKWIVEGGTAELVHGADDTRDVANWLTTKTGGAGGTFDTDVFQASGSGVASDVYPGGYVAMRYFAKNANISASDAMMKFMDVLDRGGSVDDAFNTASAGRHATEADFTSKFLSDLDSAASTSGAALTLAEATSFLKDKAGIDVSNDDTGAITGKDAGGKLEKTAKNVVHEVGSPVNWRLPSSTSSQIGGLEVRWPEGMNALNGAGGSMSFQIGASANDAFKVGFNDMRAASIGLYDEAGKKLDVTTQPKARAAIATLDKVVDLVVDQQTNIGAMLQRLDYTASNLTTSTENVQAAESAIRDADMAKEMTNYTKNNVLLQAAQSMLAQANQSSSAVLSLLQ